MYNNYYGQQYPYYNQQPQQPQQQPQANMNYMPLYFVSSEEDVKKYIVMPNQMAYFKDINSNTLYEKKADNFSNYTTKKYELKDRNGSIYPLIQENELTHIFYYRNFDLRNEINKLKEIGITRYRVDFLDEDYKEVKNIIKNIKNFL